MRTNIFFLAAISMILLTHDLHAGKVGVSPTPNGGMVPDAEVDRQGVIHLAYVLDEDVYYVKSADAGKTFTAPIRVNSEAGAAHPANMYRGPDLAIGRDGRVHVIWYSNAYQRKLPQDQWGVMYSHLNQDKTRFVPARNLNHKPSDNYSLAVDGQGKVVVFWMAGGLFLNTSRDDGETFAEARTVPDADTCECCASRAVFTMDGALHCAYREKANNLRDMYLLTQPRGQTVFRKQKISATPWEIKGCPMTGTFLTGASDGLVMAWETKGQVYFTRQNRKGSAGEIRTPAPGGKWPVALAAPDGTLLASWKKGSTLEWQLYDADNKPLGETQSKPGNNPHRHAGVVLANGEFRLID